MHEMDVVGLGHRQSIARDRQTRVDPLDEPTPRWARDSTGQRGHRERSMIAWCSAL
jgi:hypothetical protein